MYKNAILPDQYVELEKLSIGQILYVDYLNLNYKLLTVTEFYLKINRPYIGENKTYIYKKIINKTKVLDIFLYILI